MKRPRKPQASRPPITPRKIRISGRRAPWLMISGRSRLSLVLMIGQPVDAQRDRPTDLAGAVEPERRRRPHQQGRQLDHGDEEGEEAQRAHGRHAGHGQADRGQHGLHEGRADHAEGHAAHRARGDQQQVLAAPGVEPGGEAARDLAGASMARQQDRRHHDRQQHLHQCRAGRGALAQQEQQAVLEVGHDLGEQPRDLRRGPRPPRHQSLADQRNPGDPARQRLAGELVHVEVVLEQPGHAFGQRGADQRERQHHRGDQHQRGQDGRQPGAPAQARLEPDERGPQRDRDDHAPDQRAEERREDAQAGGDQRDHHHEPQQSVEARGLGLRQGARVQWRVHRFTRPLA